MFNINTEGTALSPVVFLLNC